MPDLDELLGIAVSVAQEAGDLLLDGLRRDRTSVRTKSSRTDIVTEMDLASEALIAASLRRARPRDAILGEEGAREEGDTGVRWIVDPLDGTTNYLYWWPAFAVSIAAEIDGEAAVGVVHDPSQGETYTAIRGRGARMTTAGGGDGARPPSAVESSGGRGWGPARGGEAAGGTDGGGDELLVQDARLDEALVATGFNYDAELRQRQAAVLTRVLPAVRDIRRAGAASLDLCWVAAGRLDAFYEAGLQVWDWAAGALIAAEAGAWVGDLDGGPPSRSMTLAASDQLAGPLRELLVSAGAGD